MGRSQGFNIGVVVVLLIAATIGLNYMQHLNSPTVQELQQQQDDLAAAARKAANKDVSAPPPSQMPLGPPPDQPHPKPVVDGPATVAPADFVSSNQNGTTVVELGYTVDPDTARDPKQLSGIANDFVAWAALHPNDSVKVVCLDLPKDQLSNPADDNIPLGLTINGKTVGGCDTNPGEGLFTRAYESTILSAVK